LRVLVNPLVGDDSAVLAEQVVPLYRRIQAYKDSGDGHDHPNYLPELEVNLLIHDVMATYGFNIQFLRVLAHSKAVDIVHQILDLRTLRLLKLKVRSSIANYVLVKDNTCDAKLLLVHMPGRVLYD